MKNDMVKYTRIDKEKIEFVKDKLRKRSTIWISFLFFGWSYGSLGKPVLQMLWYGIAAYSAYGVYHNFISREFTIYTAFALAFIPVWIVWGIARGVTLNKAVERYNREIADYFGLNNDEKDMLGLE